MYRVPILPLPADWRRRALRPLIATIVGTIVGALMLYGAHTRPARASLVMLEHSHAAGRGDATATQRMTQRTWL